MTEVARTNEGRSPRRAARRARDDGLATFSMIIKSRLLLLRRRAPRRGHPSAFSTPSMSFRIFDTAAGRPGGHAASARRRCSRAARLSGGTAARRPTPARYAPSAGDRAAHLHRQSFRATAGETPSWRWRPCATPARLVRATEVREAARATRVQRGLALAESLVR